MKTSINKTAQNIENLNTEREISKNYNKSKAQEGKTKEIEQHYIIWWLGRLPSQQDFDIIQNFLLNMGPKIVTFKKFVIKFRIFLGGDISYHIIIYRKYWGFSVNIHKDIGIHLKAIFNKKTLYILSKIYVHVKKAQYGKCFLLARQEKAFNKFLKFNSNKWNLI